MPTVKIKIPLTETEHAELSAKQAGKISELKIVRNDKATALGEFNAKLKTLDAELETLASEEREGARESDVEILERFDWGAGRVHVFRADTGDALPEHDRDVTIAEKGQHTQKGLFDKLPASEAALDALAEASPQAELPLDPVKIEEPAEATTDDAPDELVMCGTKLSIPGSESELLPDVSAEQDDDSEDDEEFEEEVDEDEEAL